jgi:hypothetical protein
MSSLQVKDPRSRGRSKSPSGRSRDRSHSRDVRAPSPSPEISKTALKKYYESDSADDRDARRRHTDSKYVSRSKSDYKESSRHDVTDSDEDRYRAKERTKDRYYHSESEDEVRRRPAGPSSRGSKPSQGRYKDDSEEEDRKKHQPSRRRGPSPPYASESESETDSDLSALAYGDTHSAPSRRHRRDYSSHDPRASRESVTKSSKKPSASYRLDDDSDPGAPGSHPSYARPDKFSYVQPSQYAHAQPGQFRDPRQASHSHYNGAQHPNLPPDWAPIPESERPGFVPPGSHAPPGQHSLPGAFPGAFSTPVTSQAPYSQPSSYAPTHAYANPPQWNYAQPDPNIKYGSKSARESYTQSSDNQFVKPYSASHEPQFVEIAPGQPRRPHSLSVSTNLSVGSGPGGRPPASPLLEAYKGTYQSISPMPSPMASPMLLAKDDDISDLEPLEGSGSDRRRKHKSGHLTDEKNRKDRDKKEKDRDRKKHERHASRAGEEVILISPTGRKKVSFYDPVDDAVALKGALSHHTSLDAKPLMTILPNLTSDEMLLLRTEYKNHAKVQGKGINMAKHVKMKLGSTPFGKACYATALGRWESEAYWANCYYQAGTSRRELLIESLIGRSNSDIREIKNCFRDARYADNLEKCMKAELKADKFRVAVLLALEENRQPEKGAVDIELIKRDVQELHRSLVSREGGETAMIYIIVLRSDSHLREVMRVYEATYKQNFARAMIAKSKNLVVSWLIRQRIAR